MNITKRFITLLILIASLTANAACQAAPVISQPISTPSPSAPEATSTPQPAARIWWRDAVFYEIFVRSFNDSNGDGIGDFNGITQKLDYLQSLGITAIWLMPIHPSPTYHGYDVLNYYAVNPQYGTLDDFKQLVEQAHARDIRVIIDLVLNHTSSQHPWFVDANANPLSKYRDWYIWSDTDPGQGWHQGNGSYYFGLFWGGMPDLNYRNPEVTAQMQKMAAYWLNDIGIDGFRLDAAKHLIEDAGKTENTPATHTWLGEFTTFYKTQNPDAYMVGEVYGAGGLIAKTYAGQMDEIFNFELASGFVNSANGGSNSGINSAIKLTQKDLLSGQYATFLTNHDQNRSMSVFNGDVNKARLAASLMLTAPGTPYIYYGEEVGMLGQKPDEDIRLPLPWTDDPLTAGFTTGRPWRAPGKNIAASNIAAQDKDPGSLLNHYRALIHLRNTHPALQTGTLALLDTGNSGIFASLRMENSETILVLVNLRNEKISDYKLTLSAASLQDGTYTPEVLFGSGSASALTVIDGKFAGYLPLPELAPYSTTIFNIK